MSTHQPSVKFGEPFIKLLRVASTNNYALSMLKNNLAYHGTAIFTEEQTKGKGQIGKKWITTKGDNILMSIIINISTIPLQKQFDLLAMAALGCYDFFNKYAVSETAIKWSNDIYWKDKKAGGILIETAYCNKERFAIVGIGLNINQTVFDTSLKNPVSLKQITGKTYNVIDLALELCNCINNWYQVLENGDKELLLKSYNEHLFKLNQTVTLKKENVKFNAVIKGVNEYGELMINNGFEQNFNFGEVELVLESK